jgi:hypothetical protein
LVGVINVVTVVLAIAVLVILGMLFGRRIPVAVIVFYALWGLRLVTEPPERDGFPFGQRTWMLVMAHPSSIDSTRES